MTYQEILERCFNEKIKENRLFGQYFDEYNEDCKHTRNIWVVEGEDEVKTQGNISVLHIAMPVHKIGDFIKMHQGYSADWEDIAKDHLYVCSHMMHNWRLKELSLVIESLNSQSIKIKTTEEEFNQGKQAIEILDKERRYSDTILTSFSNPHIKDMDEYVIWYCYGPQIKEEKGSAFIGTLRHMDVYGVPMMDENEIVVYDREKLAMNISPLEVGFESRRLLYLYEELIVWQIKPNSSIFFNIE